MAYFHALARLGLDGLVLIEPEEQFVSVGFFDDTEEAVDLEACRRMGLPVVRREIGGGPVLLGPGQVFYHLILPRSHHALPPRLADIYRSLSAPVIETYRHFGVEVTFRPVNDLVTSDGRKITGQGAADIGDRFCFVGAVLRHFDSALMAAVVQVPDEKVRHQVHRAIDDNMSSIARATGTTPAWEEVVDVLAASFAMLLGPLEPRPVPPEAQELAAHIADEIQSAEVLMAPRRRDHATTKIREGVEVHRRLHKAPGGLIRAFVTVHEGTISEVAVGGDFTMIPRASLSAIEDALVGRPCAARLVAEVVEDVMRHHHVESPGVTAADFAAAITAETAPAATT